MITTVLANRNEIALKGMRALLEAEADLTVLAEATDGPAALDIADRWRSRVAIVDTDMPEMSGVDATREISARFPETRVLAVSLDRRPDTVQRVFDAGASGYLLEECDADRLVDAVRLLARNQTFLSPAIGEVVVTALRQRGRPPSPLLRLSRRELQVLQYMADGYSSREIAERLHRSIKTVATHREHIMGKLGIHHIAGLTKFAVREGLSALDPLPEDPDR